jgi:hypothetical protein
MPHNLAKVHLSPLQRRWHCPPTAVGPAPELHEEWGSDIEKLETWKSVWQISSTHLVMTNIAMENPFKMAVSSWENLL